MFLESDLLARVPKVVMIRGPYLENVQMDSGKPFIISAKGDTVHRDISRFLKISFANMPRHNTENNHARRLTARLTYRDDKGKILVQPIYGRWSNSDQPKTTEDLKQLFFWELDSSGKPEPLDVAFKIDSEKHCYAYNSDCYFVPNLKKPEFQLTSNVIDVLVELRGERVKRNFRIRFFNDGENSPLRLDENNLSLRRLLRSR